MRTLTLHATLLFVAAVLALRYADDDVVKGGEAEVAVVEGSRLERVTMVTEGGTVVVEPAREDQSALPRVRLTRMVVDENAAPREPVQDASAADGGVDEETLPKVEKTFTFPGGSTVTRAVEALLPLKARRVLDDVPAERLSAMGLESPKSTITLVVDGREHAFDIGEKTYGNTARYLRRRGERQVVLVDNNAITGLEGTETKLAERRLVSVGSEDITGLALSVDGRERAFVHQDREQSQKRFFAPKDTPDERSDEADAVVSTLRKLRAREFVDVPPEAVPVVVFRLEREGKGPIEGALWPVVDGAATARVGAWTARVSESQAKELIDDARAAVP